MKKISILIVEDHTLVREALRTMLELHTEFEVIGEVNDGRKAVSLASEIKPDVILMDIAMPRLNGLEATRQLIKMTPKTRIIILTAHSDDAYVKSAVDSGAVGFLLKQDTTHDLCRAIRQVDEGKVFYSKSIAKRFLKINTKSSNKSGKMARKASLLSSREMEVLQLIAEGKANKETADELGISIKTVEKHRGTLMDKLDIHHTAGLTRYAISAGIIEISVQVTIL